MATALTPQARDLGGRVSEFARKHIAPRDRLHLKKDFPPDLWQAMGDEDLLGLALSEEFGGQGASALEILMAAHSLVRDGHNIGMALSFLIHQIVSRYIIQAWASPEQKTRYLKDLAKGRITACLAVSEPKTGAHPKHIKSIAEKIPGGYVLNGEKSYLTNGPIADLYVIIAVSDIDSGKKRFSAFLVPRDTEGLDILEPLDIPFFRPSPHGSIRFEGMKVPEDALLGPEDTAYETMVLPFRAIEDALMTGAVTGALEKQAQLLSEALSEKNEPYDEFLKMDLGKLKYMLDTAKILSYEAAAMVDSGKHHADQTSLNLFFRNLAREYHIQLEIILKNARIEKTGLLEAITNDLAASASIGGQVVKIKQMKLGTGNFLNGNHR